MTRPANTSRFIRILPDIAAFALSLGLAYGLHWQTADLVWGLWLSSLVLGYLSLLSAIAAPALMGLYIISRPDLTGKQRVVIVCGACTGALFLLGFFSLHFCGFHAGHAVFLNHFFPLPSLPGDSFGNAFMNPPLLWLLAWRHLVRPYGLFLIPTIIAERHHIFKPLISAVKGLRNAAAGETPTPQMLEKRDPSRMGDAMMPPYVNVVRMPLLIFFFAFTHTLSPDSFLIYATVYTVYFFPWQELKSTLAKKKPPRAQRQNPRNQRIKNLRADA